ncbi:MAG TPA: ABC transporter permease subunit [Acidimicrobiia bacterium]|jgi:general L-amino acid transport system permease protein|nr:ABC transporter permease subunit [Acidimicrobiia bacterium]
MTTTVRSRPRFYRDVRILTWAFQLLVFAVVAAVGLWLWGNFRRNTASSGIPTSFDFLSNPTTFSIPGADFSPNEPVRNAYIVGLINTLRVSIVGIVFATIVGVLVGIGRLAQNWVVSRLSTVYVELFRNLPLLVLLTFIFLGVVLQFLPAIADSWTPLGWFVFSNRGIGVPWYDGISGWSLVGLVAVGGLGWWLIARWRRKVHERTGRPSRGVLLGGGFFVLALVLGWVALGGGITLPAVDGRQIAGGIRVDPSFFALLIALSVYTASHIAEIVRGAIQAIPKGQSEAAMALALKGFQRMWYVILPQAMRVAIPPLGNQYLNLIKNSSLGAGFAYFELTNVTQVTVGNGSPAVPAFFLTLLFYVVLSLVTSAIVNIANRRFKVVER